MDNAFHKNCIRRCFNKAASTYDAYSHPQQQIGRQLIQKIIPYFTTVESIVDLGCGTGIVTEYLANALRYQHFFAMDLSDKSVEKAKIRLQRFAIQISQGDFDTWQSGNVPAQIVFSNMSLQWSCDLLTTLQTVRLALSPDGIFAFALPLCDTFVELPASMRNTLRTREQISVELHNAGFEILSCDEERLVMQFDSILQALKSIKGTGANHLFRRSTSPLLSKAFVKTELPSLTYHIGYFIVKACGHVS